LFTNHYEEVNMPRKQRFKPSRKPKPNPPGEDTMTGHQGTRVHNDNAVDPHSEPQAHTDTPDTEPDVAPPSR
jgi:hypothetical protein